jgi:hypothetical protein
VIVGVHQRVLTPCAAKNFRGAVGENLIGVHVVRGARARLVDVDDNLIAQRAGADLVACLNDCVGDAFVEAA